MRDSYTCPRCDRTSYNANDIANFYCGHCHKTAQEMRDEPVTIFAELSPTLLTRRDCFSLALCTLMFHCQDIPEARLVHAWVSDSFNAGRLIEHAWVEVPATATYTDGSEAEITVIVDYSQIDPRAHIRPAQEIHALLSVQDEQRFTRKEALANVLRYGHDGPWPPWGNANEPTTWRDENAQA